MKLVFDATELNQPLLISDETPWACAQLKTLLQRAMSNDVEGRKLLYTVLAWIVRNDAFDTINPSVRKLSKDIILSVFDALAEGESPSLATFSERKRGRPRNAGDASKGAVYMDMEYLISEHGSSAAASRVLATSGKYTTIKQGKPSPLGEKQLAKIHREYGRKQG